MIWISHRGNLVGPDGSAENDPKRILEVRALGFDVEVDVRFEKGDFFLGHDRADHKVHPDFLKTSGLWLHAKTRQSLEALSRTKANFFWHQEDDYTLTSHGFIWCHSKRNDIENAIWCLPPIEILKAGQLPLGICSDKVQQFKDHLK